MPTKEELAPNRQLEYAQGEQVTLGLALVCLLLGLAGCCITYWHWCLTTSGGTNTPLLLFPSWRGTLRILGYGTLLPLLGYYVYSRWLPWNGREYAFGISSPLVLTEFALLLLLLLGVTLRLTAQTVRHQCMALGIPVPSTRGGTIWWRTCCGLSILLVIALLVLMIVLRKGDCLYDDDFKLAMTPGLVGLAGLGLLALGALTTNLFGRRAFDLYHGSLARTLIPLLALNTLILVLLARPYLVMREKSLIRRDTLLKIDAETGATTTAEARLVRQLTAEIRQAAEALPPAPRIETQK